MSAPSSPVTPATDGGPSATLRRRLPLLVCALLVAALLAVAAWCPLPYSVAQPGLTADVLGENKGEPVITITTADGADGARQRHGDGKLLLTTIAATPPRAMVRAVDVLTGWLATDRAVMPHDVVYPVGDSPREIREYNRATMKESQDAAVRAALAHLGRSPREVRVELRLRDVGGPSAGLLFALGIVEKLAGDGHGGDLTGGRVIAGTGTIDAEGRVGPVGGVPLKTQAARRDGATVFLVPKEECAKAQAEKPDGLRLVPVTTLRQAVDALTALRDGGRVPSC